MFVLAICFVLFCYQMNTATMSLMNPPMVDSSYDRNITDDDLPLVTVCPTDQNNLNGSYSLEYGNLLNLLIGKIGGYFVPESNTSWTGSKNLTFKDLITEAFDSERVRDLDGDNLTNELVFIPGYGLCKEFSNITQEMTLYNLNKEGEVRVLITNKNYRSFIMPDISSHTGSQILMKPNQDQYYNVKIKVESECNRDKQPMNRLDYEKCVDDKIQKEFELNKIDCVPPWLSSHKQCKQTYPGDFLDNFSPDFVKNYVMKVYTLNNIKHEHDCRQSCRKTNYFVHVPHVIEDPNMAAQISFDPKVAVTEKVANYDMFKYIIDVGSSLGLWLGLSVLSVHDLLVIAVQFINNNFFIKKIRSAFTK